MKPNPVQKKYLIIGGILVLFLIIGFFVIKSRNKPGPDMIDQTPTDDVIPTVSSSVKVSLEARDNQNKQVILSASAIPTNTDSIEYELSYLTSSQGLQGVIGTLTMEGKNKFEKELTLGTCSSGTCVYHEVVGKIKLTLRFNGNYGAKLFEKEYVL